MSNAIPMALRPAARISHQWNSVTLAFARRYCTQPSCFNTSPQSSILSVLQSRSLACSRRPFSTTPRFAAKVHNPLDDVVPPQQSPPQQRTRTVKIGPLPNGRVDEATIRRIFGPRVSAIEGNHVLRILHHRRTSGSLADYGVDNLGQQYTHINRSLATKALDWLRETYPIDEARAAEEWAEKEANRIAYELWLADPENDSKYKDPARVFREQQKKQKEEQAEQEALQERYEGRQKIGMLHVGPSEFERNIAERRRERLEAVTQKAEEKEAKEQEHEAKLATGEWVRTPSGTQLMKPGQTTYVDVFGREQVSRRKEMMEKYQQKAQTEFKDEAEMLSKTTVVCFAQPSPYAITDYGDRPSDSTQ
jgi:rhomboid-like protein